MTTLQRLQNAAAIKTMSTDSAVVLSRLDALMRDLAGKVDVGLITEIEALCHLRMYC